MATLHIESAILAGEIEDRRNEGVWLNHLSLSCADLGDPRIIPSIEVWLDIVPLYSYL